MDMAPYSTPENKLRSGNTAQVYSIYKILGSITSQVKKKEGRKETGNRARLDDHQQINGS